MKKLLIIGLAVLFSAPLIAAQKTVKAKRNVRVEEKINITPDFSGFSFEIRLFQLYDAVYEMIDDQGQKTESIEKDQKEKIGYIIMRTNRNKEDGSWDAWLYEMFVAKEFRNVGYAHQLLDKALYDILPAESKKRGQVPLKELGWFIAPFEKIGKRSESRPDLKPILTAWYRKVFPGVVVTDGEKGIVRASYDLTKPKKLRDLEIELLPLLSAYDQQQYGACHLFSRRIAFLLNKKKEMRNYVINNVMSVL